MLALPLSPDIEGALVPAVPSLLIDAVFAFSSVKPFKLTQTIHVS